MIRFFPPRGAGASSPPPPPEASWPCRRRSHIRPQDAQATEHGHPPPASACLLEIDLRPPNTRRRRRRPDIRDCRVPRGRLHREFGVSAPQSTSVVAPSSSSRPSRLAAPMKALFAFLPTTVSPSSGAAQRSESMTRPARRIRGGRVNRIVADRGRAANSPPAMRR